MSRNGNLSRVAIQLSIILTAPLMAIGLAACPLENDLKSIPLRDAESAYLPNLNVGSSARQFFGDNRFDEVIVEIDAVAGMAPSQEALNYLQRFLQRHLGKNREQVRIYLDEIPSPERQRYSIREIREIEDKYRNHFTQRNVLAIYLLFVDGKSRDDRGNVQILGQAHRNTSVVIFENTILNLVLGPSDPGIGAQNSATSLWVAEATVMAHEMGHVFGLVNTGAEMQSPHEDADVHPNHCLNDKCLMHHAAETSLGLAALGNKPPEFGPECKADLEAMTKKN